MYSLSSTSSLFSCTCGIIFHVSKTESENKQEVRVQLLG